VIDYATAGDLLAAYGRAWETFDGDAWVAIFPEVAEGSYELVDDHGDWLAEVDVAGGLVQELDLR